MSLDPRQLPPYLYLPARVGDDGESFEPELRDDDSGPGLPAYTALDRLRRVWGRDQQWAVVALPDLTAVQQRTGFTALLVDDGLPEEERARE